MWTNISMQLLNFRHFHILLLALPNFLTWYLYLVNLISILPIWSKITPLWLPGLSQIAIVKVEERVLSKNWKGFNCSLFSFSKMLYCCCRYIGVDVYGNGGCSDPGLTCPRSEDSKCIQMLNTTYKVTHNSQIISVSQIKKLMVFFSSISPWKTRHAKTMLQRNYGRYLVLM